MITKNITPDTITIPEAVAALVEYFEAWDIIFSSLDLYTCITVRNSWRGGEKPDWVNAIINGNETPAAVMVGLEDLFTTILMDAKEAAS